MANGVCYVSIRMLRIKRIVGGLMVLHISRLYGGKKIIGEEKSNMRDDTRSCHPMRRANRDTYLTFCGMHNNCHSTMLKRQLLLL